MNTLFAQLGVVDVHRDITRNIVSVRQTQSLFDDLADEASDWLLAQQLEAAVRSPAYRSESPVIDRPFEDAEWFNAIDWPFRHWGSSRFSDGSHGVWYGSESVETSVHESAFHWYRGLLSDAHFERESVVAERSIYQVACDALLLDFRKATARHRDLLHPSDSSLTQSVGTRLHREGHPGLIIQSVRRPAGENIAVFNSRILSRPRHDGDLLYRLEGTQIRVEKQPGIPWLSLETSLFSPPHPG